MKLKDLKPSEEFTLEPTKFGDYANPKRVMIVLEQYPDSGITVIDKLSNKHIPEYDGVDSIGVNNETKVYIRGVAFHLNRFCQHECMKYPFYPEG